MAVRYCEKCHGMLDEKEFYKSNNLEKYPQNGLLNVCKKCLTMHVDPWDRETFDWILQEVDVPYVKDKWDSVLARYTSDPNKRLTGTTIIGRYLSIMKLKQWKEKRYKDTEAIAEDLKTKKAVAMRSQGMTEDEIEENLNIDTTPPKPVEIPEAQDEPQIEVVDENDQLAGMLTEEEKRALRIKWGDYRVDEWLKLEQLYNDMCNSYDIQGAGMKDTLIMICKASVRANALIDGGDVEGFQKMSKVYNDLMKSAKLTAAQIKSDDEGEIDSIGEIVALCESEGFIPRYYVATPQDHVDRTLQDMQGYTRSLVMEELGLSSLIESAVKEIEADKAREAKIETDGGDMDDEAKFEASLFADSDPIGMSDIDAYKEFQDFEEGLQKQDEEALTNGSE